MKHVLLFILISLTHFSCAQVESLTKYVEIYEDVLVRNIKQFDNHYLLHLDHLMYDELREHILNCDKTYCMNGLAYMNANFEYQWIYVPKVGGITDFWEDDEHIYILNNHRKNSKISSTATLYKLTLNKKGKLIDKQKIEERSFDAPNATFYAKFDKSGQIWKFLDIPYKRNLDNSVNHSPRNHSYVVELLSLSLDKKATYRMNGQYLRFKTFDAKSNQVSFIFDANDVVINDEELESTKENQSNSSVLLLQFKSDGKLTTDRIICTNDCHVEDIKYQKENLIIVGYYGHDSIVETENRFLLKNKLETVENDRLKHHSFVTSIDENLHLNWTNTFLGKYSIYFNSLSTLDDKIAVNFNHVDSVFINKKGIQALNPNGKYNSNNPMICYFDKAGKLTTYEQLPCYSSSWNKVYLFPNSIAVHGTFLYNIDVMGNALQSPSKSSVHYLMFNKN